jgi:hypothetical protein
MRDSAHLRHDVAAVRRYLASLRTLHGDRSGRLPLRPPTAAAATPRATGSSAPRDARVAQPT